jgi:uncharacterized membrane protein
MRIPSRAQVDAFCGSPTTRYQRIAGILAPLMLLGSIVYILIIWHTLPEKIPTHYNAAGEIDGYGGRGSLLLMPIIGLLTDLTVAICARFPKSWNTGVRITVLNRARVYRVLRDMMADMRLSCALAFAGFAVYQANLPEHFGGWVLPVMILLIVVPILRYFIRLRRAR